MNVLSQPVLAYFFYHVAAVTDLREATWRVVVYEYSVLSLASFLACARDASFFHGELTRGFVIKLPVAFPSLYLVA